MAMVALAHLAGTLGGSRAARPSFSAGVFQSNVLRGRPLSWLAMRSSSIWLRVARSLPLGRYWRSSPLVFSLRPALPRRVRIAEVHLNAGLPREALVRGQLSPLVPSQRLRQMRGERPDPLDDRVDHPLGAMPVLQAGQQHIAGVPLDQRRDRRLVIRAHQQIALPMPGDGAILNLRPAAQRSRSCPPSDPAARPAERCRRRVRPERRSPFNWRRNSPRACTNSD